LIQKINDILMASFHCDLDRSLSIVINGINRRAMVDECTRQIAVSKTGGIVQGGPS